MIYPVAVESNRLKPLNSTLALGFYLWVSTEGRAKWLFLCLFTITAHSVGDPIRQGMGDSLYCGKV
jgi:hypothetical protein